jgi:hypothetical protein
MSEYAKQTCNDWPLSCRYLGLLCDKLGVE